MTLARRAWSEEELHILATQYPDQPSAIVAQALRRPLNTIYSKAQQLGIKKSAAFYASGKSGRIERGRQHPSIVATQFKRGQKSWNKGMKGWSPEGSKATQFQPGRPACEASNYRPIGSVRLSNDGYMERKVTDDPSIYPARRWVAVHRLVWEAANGPIPNDHMVVFLPGKLTTDVDAITTDILECITRKENMRRNSHARFPPQVRQLIGLKGAITRQVNRINRETQEGAAE